MVSELAFKNVVAVMLKERRLLHTVFSIVALSCVRVCEVFAQEGGQQVFSPAPPNAQGNPGLFEGLFNMLPLIAICYLIFWTMVIRPQEAKTKQHKVFIEGLKRGDTVVTSGGILGRVAGVEADGVLVEVSQNVKIKVQQAHVSALEPGTGTSKAA